MYLDRHRFAKAKLSLAPNNPSAWNYLRGVLDHTRTPYGTLRAFVEPYAASREPGPIMTSSEEDVEDPLPAEHAELPAPAAIEFLAEVLESEGGEDGRHVAAQLYRSLADRHDAIRKK
jgi:protein farnesyltransferase/geranylgeranyltransferase type-1 subunit alpha